MRRIAGLLALALAATVLTGCVYDPYTGTYVPCCGYYGYPYYGYPYYRAYGYRYRYPAPYGPYGYPSGPNGPPQGQPGTYPSPSGQPGTYSSPPEQPLPRPGAALSPGDAAAPAQHLAAATSAR